MDPRISVPSVAFSSSACLVQTLTFVAVRLTLSEAQKERLQPQPATARRLGVSATAAGKAQTPLSVAPSTIRQQQDLIFIAAQQFQGYVFDVNNEEVRGMVFTWPRPCSSTPASSCISLGGHSRCA